MVTRGDGTKVTNALTEGFPGELRAPVEHNVFRDAMKTEHMLNEEVSHLQGLWKFGKWEKVRHFGKTICYGEDGGITI